MEPINGKVTQIITQKDMEEALANSRGMIRGGIFFTILGTLLTVMIMMSGSSDGGWTAAAMLFLGYACFEYGQHLSKLPAPAQVRFWRSREKAWKDNLPDYYKNPPGIG